MKKSPGQERQESIELAKTDPYLIYWLDGICDPAYLTIRRDKLDKPEIYTELNMADWCRTNSKATRASEVF